LGTGAFLWISEYFDCIQGTNYGGRGERGRLKWACSVRKSHNFQKVRNGILGVMGYLASLFMPL